MTTRSQIETNVAELVIDATDYATSNRVSAIQAAQAEIEDSHGFRIMEDSHELVTSAGQRTLGAKPPDWKDRRGKPVRVDGLGHSVPIEWMPSTLDQERIYDPDDPLDLGAPKHVLETDTGFDVYPLPDGLAVQGSVYSDGEYRIRIPYWKRLGLLSSPGSSNWFTDNASRFLIWRATAELLYGNRDYQAAALYWIPRNPPGGFAGVELRRLIRRDILSRLRGSPLMVPRMDRNAPSTQERA